MKLSTLKQGTRFKVSALPYMVGEVKHVGPGSVTVLWDQRTDKDGEIIPKRREQVAASIHVEEIR